VGTVTIHYRPLTTYCGYTVWHGHPASDAAWCASGSDGTVWFEAADFLKLCALIDWALTEDAAMEGGEA
jgi:hypothetical protein